MLASDSHWVLLVVLVVFCDVCGDGVGDEWGTLWLWRSVCSWGDVCVSVILECDQWSWNRLGLRGIRSQHPPYAEQNLFTGRNPSSTQSTQRVQSSNWVLGQPAAGSMVLLQRARLHTQRQL